MSFASWMLLPMRPTFLGERVEMSSRASLTARRCPKRQDQRWAVAMFGGVWAIGLECGRVQGRMRGQILPDVLAMAALDDFVGAELSNGRARNQTAA